MKIERKFDEKRVESIARGCGSNSVRKSIAWLRRANYNNPDKFICEIIDDVAFWAADLCKNHMRLYETAVLLECQKKGYGRLMILRMRKVCKEHNLEKITFRTAKNESAIDFYKKLGGVIVGEKGNDWEVEIRV